MATKMSSVKAGGLWWQVQLQWNVGTSGENVWSVKIGGLSWQWSLKTDFTVQSTYIYKYKKPDQDFPKKDLHGSTGQGPGKS